MSEFCPLNDDSIEFGRREIFDLIARQPRKESENEFGLMDFFEGDFDFFLFFLYFDCIFLFCLGYNLEQKKRRITFS